MSYSFGQTSGSVSQRAAVGMYHHTALRLCACLFSSGRRNFGIVFGLGAWRVLYQTRRNSPTAKTVGDSNYIEPGGGEGIHGGRRRFKWRHIVALPVLPAGAGRVARAAFAATNTVFFVTGFRLMRA